MGILSSSSGVGSYCANTDCIPVTPQYYLLCHSSYSPISPPHVYHIHQSRSLQKLRHDGNTETCLCRFSISVVWKAWIKLQSVCKSLSLQVYNVMQKYILEPSSKVILVSFPCVCVRVCVAESRPVWLVSYICWSLAGFSLWYPLSPSCCLTACSSVCLSRLYPHSPLPSHHLSR